MPFRTLILLSCLILLPLATSSAQDPSSNDSVSEIQLKEEFQFDTSQSARPTSVPAPLDRSPGFSNPEYSQVDYSDAEYQAMQQSAKISEQLPGMAEALENAPQEQEVTR